MSENSKSAKAKKQHANIMLAILGFGAVVIAVALIGFFTLDRDPDKLSTYNRPLSQNGGVYRIYDERYPIYSACCDVRIENNGKDFTPAAVEIMSK